MDRTRKEWWLSRSVVDTSTGCWIWNRATKGNGYGNIRIGSKNFTAHRLAYECLVGETGSGLDVCHTCDVRSCVNPDHLFLGTRKTNMQDAVNKGRQAKGSGVPHSRLTEDEVISIRRRVDAGEQIIDVSRDYPHVCRHTVGNAAKKRTWRHI